MEVSGRVKLGEGQYVQPAYLQRLIGWRSNGLLIWVAFMAAMFIGMDGAFNRPAQSHGIYVVIVALLLMFAWIASQRNVLVRAWRARGAPEDTEVLCTIEDRGLRIASPAVDSLLHWGAITDICPGNKRWLFMVHEGVYFVMKSFFADAASERAFLSACLERLSPESRDRSGKALAYVDQA